VRSRASSPTLAAARVRRYCNGEATASVGTFPVRFALISTGARVSAYLTRIVVALLLTHIAAFAAAAATPSSNEEALVRVSPRPAVLVVLPPLAQFPEFTDGQDAVEEELIGVLVGAGYKVRRLVRSEFITALTEEIAAVGGIYDPVTGQQNLARHEEALGRLTRRLVDENEAAMVLSSRLVLRTATVRGDAAEWDGQVRMGRTTQGIDQTVVWSGTTKGLSLELTGFRSNGERVFKTYGGLVLPYRLDMAQSKLELRRSFFPNRGEVVEGSLVALKPLLRD
jgi:hypothetical protein